MKKALPEEGFWLHFSTGTWSPAIPPHPSASPPGVVVGRWFTPLPSPFKGTPRWGCGRYTVWKSSFSEKHSPQPSVSVGQFHQLQGFHPPAQRLGGGGAMVELGTAGSGLGWLAAGTGLGFKPWWWPWLVLAMAVLPWGLQCLIRAGEWALTCMAWG